MMFQEATLEKCQQENTSLQNSLKDKEEEVRESNALTFILFKSLNGWSAVNPVSGQEVEWFTWDNRSKARGKQTVVENKRKWWEKTEL